MTKLLLSTAAAAAACVAAGPAAASAAPKIPVEPFPPTANEQVRPAAITLTGDGSAWFGGRTGHAVVNGTRFHRTGNTSAFGHLKWTTYNSQVATAKGVEWFKVDFTHFLFRIDATVALTFTVPRRGFFTELTIRETYTHNYRQKQLVGKTQTHTYNYLTQTGS